MQAVRMNARACLSTDSAQYGCPGVHRAVLIQPDDALNATTKAPLHIISSTETGMALLSLARALTRPPGRPPGR